MPTEPIEPSKPREPSEPAQIPLEVVADAHRPNLEYVASGRGDGRRRLGRMHWLLLLLVFYAAWCGLLYFMQDAMIFPRAAAPPPGEQGLPDGAVELRLDLPNDEHVVGWLMPLAGASGAHPAPLAILFHGNAELIDYQDWHVENYHRLGYSVFLPEYRGYGRSDGEPSQKGIVADAVEFYDQLARRADIDARQIIFHGWSIGGSIATQVALQRPPVALILQSTPASIKEMSWSYGAPSFLVRHPFDTEKALKTLQMPVLIIHGRQDEIVPIAHAYRLAKAARDGEYAEFEADHNHLPNPVDEVAYWQRIEAFLNRTATRGPAVGPLQPKQAKQQKQPGGSATEGQKTGPRKTLLK